MVRTREDRAERADAGFRVVCAARVVVDDVTPTIPSVHSGTAGGALDTGCAPLELTQVATARASGIGRVISDERCGALRASRVAPAVAIDLVPGQIEIRFECHREAAGGARNEPGAARWRSIASHGA